MKHVSTRVLFAYWDGLRGERAAPDRADIEPGRIRHILADMFILDLEEPGLATFRLAGTRVCALLGGEQKGREFTALWPRRGGDDIAHLVETVSRDAGAVVGAVVGRSRRGASIDLELLMLPLCHRGRDKARLLGALSPALVPYWLGFDQVVSLSLLSLRMVWPSGRPPQDATDRRPRFTVHPGGRA